MTTPNRLNPNTRLRLDAYLDQVDQVLLRSGQSREHRRSITDDLEMQILEMLAAQNLPDPSPADLESILARLDRPEAYAQGSRPSAPPPPPPPRPAEPASQRNSLPVPPAPTGTAFERHQKIVAWLHIGFGALGLLLYLSFSALFSVFIPFFRGGQGFNSIGGFPFPWAFFGIPLFAMFWGVCLTLPGIIGGWGLLNQRSWARILILIISALQVFSFPFGTALCLYSFWTLWNLPDSQPAITR